MPRLDEKQHALKLGTFFFAVGATLAACASYQDSDKLHSYDSAEDGGTDSRAPLPTLGGGGAGGNAASDTGGTPASAGTASGGTAPGAAGSGVDTGGSSPSISGAGGASSENGGVSGSAVTGGTNGEGGSSGGSAGTAGASAGGRGGIGGNGTAGTPAGGAGGTNAVDQLLSQGKPATADSEETDKGNLAALGNDGSATTRWCAADGAGGHHWQVDLGKSFTLGKLQIAWEKAAVYQFKVEGSLDASTWSSLVDQTASTNATAAQSYPLVTAPVARYVRITTTKLPSANIWASFFEFQVYGH